MQEYMNWNKTVRNLCRWFIYLLGIWGVSLGIVLCVKCNLGISPISSVSYVLSLAFTFSFGDMTMLFHFVNIIIQYIFEKKLWNVRVLLQIPLAFLFGRVIDFLNHMITIEANYLPIQLLLLALSVFFTALGMVLMVNMKLIQNPPDGVVYLVSKKLQMDLGKVKVCYDMILVVTSIVISFLCMGKIEGFGVATIVSAIFVGRVVALLQKMQNINFV